VNDVEQKPKLRVYETMGGYWRVVAHGEDEIRDQMNEVPHAILPIAHGATREEAVARAREWFAQIDSPSQGKEGR
jgi:hypothetical protein